MLVRWRKDEGQSRQSLPDFDAFHHMFVALSDMQDAYFQRWLGTWPQGIDWTRAVINTHVAAALRTVSTELELSRPDQGVECATRKEELIAGYFADIVAYYFGEDAFSLRNQAYDDMLWVVLGWLESIQFSDEHGRFLSSMAPLGAGITTTTTNTAAPGPETWYGSRWTPAFAHRARIFWELAAKGWDTSLCGGGMLWNPRLMPYKNAITNQLFISASISMYLHFPGDANTSPFSTPTQASASHASPKHQPWRPHDPVFARAAQRAHAWLAASNMTNAHGLYADGFHISGHNDSGDGNNNTRCDTRDEMVYTYNQGVLLSGLLGLFRATRREAYLREGHALIKNVVRATGWDLDANQPVDENNNNNKEGLPPWRGLGRWGVLEEACDVAGTCSQDAQTFKGVWMHHFAAFCGAGVLSSRSSDSADDNNEEEEMERVRAWHAGECRRYVPWLRRNARAAMGTKDERGLFGMWWTPGLLAAVTREEVEVEMEKGGDGMPPPSARMALTPGGRWWTTATGACRRRRCGFASPTYHNRYTPAAAGGAETPGRGRE
ncbi:hypothetical protein NEMBOFW57_003475 [Staphylotrichum longicolle]|uniref:Glycosyl hydrolase n=1 Tax=Staphylotrichum longicolle TaxID=669026 RepID=A0AAD4F5S5_9PEZI|nr:hypothetical protein NEMBOFW57_003475 [Staphylotrichum longicolle]